MNNSQPNGGGKGIMIMIIVIVLLIAIGVGVYFGYTKWWVPKQCVGQDATSNVATFMWDSDSGTCVANVCISGYGSGSTAKTAGTPPCTAYVAPKYSQVDNEYFPSTPQKTCTGSSSTSQCILTNQTDIEAACDADSTCNAYGTNDSANYVLFNASSGTPATTSTSWTTWTKPTK